MCVMNKSFDIIFINPIHGATCYMKSFKIVCVLLVHDFINLLLLFRIPELETPEQRMLAVVEWYLTSFHAGRQVSNLILVVFLIIPLEYKWFYQYKTEKAAFLSLFSKSPFYTLIYIILIQFVFYHNIAKMVHCSKIYVRTICLKCYKLKNKAICNLIVRVPCVHAHPW